MIRRPLVIPAEMHRIPKLNFDAIAGRMPLVADGGADIPLTTRFVFVCFTNRSGSNFLCDLLSSTGVVNYPRELLNADVVLSHCEATDIKSFAEYFWTIVRRDANEQIFAMKIAAEQIMLLVLADVLDRISERTHFLLVNRSDKLGQAISRAIVEQNQRWAWDLPAGIPDSELRFSPAQIAEQIEHITLQNRAFDRFFAMNGIVPVNIEYEWMVSQPQQVLDEIGRRLDMTMGQVEASQLYFRRQANQVNIDWRRRFLRWTDAATNEAGSDPVKVDIVAHVCQRGDVSGAGDTWIGAPGSRLWIEGFSITPNQGIDREDIEYQAILESGQILPFGRGGTYCGTRGRALRLRGICVRLRNAAVDRHECMYVGSFLDGSIVGPVPAGLFCQSASLAPLEAFTIIIRPRL